MNDFFPFNLPGPTAWYAVLYVLTLLLHAIFMSYVLAGSIMLGVAGLRGMLGRTGKPSVWAPLTTVLKDWMPFALSAAITAGIAPLLFVQILYQQEFYTANLLSFHRWMAIVPVLIVAFYLLYLLKAHRIEGKTAVQGIVAMIVMACVLFVGWSWAENHLLSIDHAAWSAQYESRALLYTNAAIVPRLAFWIAAAFPTAGLLLAWQLRGGASGTSASDVARSIRPLAWVSIVSLLLASVAALPVLTSAGPGGRVDWQQPSIVAWMVVALVGASGQAVLWVPPLLGRALGALSLWIGTVGGLLFWLGTLATREAIRLDIVQNPALLARHDRVGTIAGLAIFLTFAVIGLGVIGWIVASVIRATSEHPKSTTSSV